MNKIYNPTPILGLQFRKANKTVNDIEQTKKEILRSAKKGMRLSPNILLCLMVSVPKVAVSTTEIEEAVAIIPTELKKEAIQLAKSNIENFTLRKTPKVAVESGRSCLLARKDR
jgi:histidinol dehydrogenase